VRDWVIFVGPSLEVDVARSIFKAFYAPPIRRRDLEAYWDKGARRFAIIDGEFGQSLAVSLTEIRTILRSGGVVCGASSMGALRAAEAKPLGMIGFGWIYEQYCNEKLTSDDEVALTFDAASGAALTLPLVNVRWALDRAVESSRCSAEEASALLGVAASVPYFERTGARLLAAAPPSLRPAMDALCRMMASDPAAFDRKRLDAIELLSWLARSGHTLAPQPTACSRAPAFTVSDPPAKAVFLGAPELTEKAPGTQRQLSPEMALLRAVESAKSLGMSRLADVSRLDVLGVHTWNSIRPETADQDNTVTGGKGLTRESAIVAACLEAVERACMTPLGRPEYVATVEQMTGRGCVVHPRELVLDVDSPWHEREPLYWWPTRDLLSDDEVWVTATNVFFPFVKGPRLHSQCSTGLAAGASLAEAVLYGLLEVLERHATTRFEYVRRAALVRLDELPDVAVQELLSRLAEAGVSAHAWLLESEFTIPTFRVVLDDGDRRDRRYLNGGYACHLDPTEALRSALLEAVYARASVIAGAREDLDRPETLHGAMGYEVARGEVLSTRNAGNVTLAALRDTSTASISDDLAFVLGELRRGGCSRVLAADLSSTDSDFKVARSIVPGLAFAPTGKRISPRLIAAIHRFGIPNVAAASTVSRPMEGRG
jgi:YcaO-like protein with predicted kinase domain